MEKNYCVWVDGAETENIQARDHFDAQERAQARWYGHDVDVSEAPV